MGRVGLVALFAAARGYAFHVELSIPAGRGMGCRPGSTTRRVPSKKTARMGDEGKAVGCVPPTALLSELRSYTLLQRSLWKSSKRSANCDGLLLLRLLIEVTDFWCGVHERKRNQQQFASRQNVLVSFVDNLLQALQWVSHGVFVLGLTSSSLILALRWSNRPAACG
jgi:hypothetical protein